MKLILDSTEEGLRVKGDANHMLLRQPVSKWMAGVMPALGVGAVAVIFNVAAQVPPIDLSLARRYFSEAETSCQRDNSKLWGVSLCGPMLFVDPKTRAVAANQGDLEGRLKNSGEVFVGKLPNQMNIANTAVEWAGVKWAMMIWPLPADQFDRAGFMMHELWHRIQDQIRLPGSMPANSHLDSMEGRVWLQLEWRALESALKRRGTQRRRAVSDALIFRVHRRTLFPKAEQEERALEMHEGLAEYSGARLSGRPDVIEFAARQIKEAERNRSFTRSFAYASGPAYGLLLDEAGKEWRKGLRPESDFGLLLQRAMSLKPPQNIGQAIAEAAPRYASDALRASETERENDRQRRIAAWRACLVDGPALVIPLRQMNMQFDPNNLQPLDDLGTVYPNIRIVDVWGILTVSQGALMNPTFSQIRVPAPRDSAPKPIQGDGWTLELNPGWTLIPAERKGDYTLGKNE
jgi:hypothetical protein